MNISKIIRFVVVSLFFGQLCLAQQSTKSYDFWEKVNFGGGAGLNFSSNYTNISLAPMGVYNFNSWLATGLSLQYSYMKLNNRFTTQLYGGSLIQFVHPTPELQLSAELEQLYVNQEIEGLQNQQNQFWNTALFLGFGYRSGNVIAGIRYNVLFRESQNIYPQAWMPFIRVFF